MGECWCMLDLAAAAAAAAMAACCCCAAAIRCCCCSAKMADSGRARKPRRISMSVGYGRRGSPCCQFSGADTAFEALMRWPYLIRSSAGTGIFFARSIDDNFSFAC